MEARILRHWLLSGVPKDQLAPILANAQAVRFLPGEVVFEEGDPADGVYLISTGAMDVTATDEQGRVVLARISADDVLGEMGVLDGQPRSGTATADEHCTAYFVPRERFVEALRGSPALCTRLLALLAKRLRAVNDRIVEAPRAAPRPSTGQRTPAEPPAPSSAPTSATPAEGAQTTGRRAAESVPEPSESFYDWLMRHTDWAESVGDLARFAANEPGWPRDARDVDTILRYLEYQTEGARLQRALGRAWAKWELTGRQGNPMGDFIDAIT
ncbi:MAG TPA: YozE family protein [Chloroflexota bacterium]|nr:YozE family protein [Chloroflexota bacterium]